MQEESVDIAIERVHTQGVYQDGGTYTVRTRVPLVSPDETRPFVELTLGTHKHYFYGEELDTLVRVLQAAQDFILAK